MLKKVALVCVVAAMASGVVEAGVVLPAGTQGLAVNGTITATNSDITQANSFSLSGLAVTANSTGAFQNIGSNKDLGGAVLNLAPSQSITLGSASFGTFTASSVSTVLSLPYTPPGTVGLVVVSATGVFQAGSDLVAAGFSNAKEAASLTITFTQNGPGTAITASANLSVGASVGPQGVPLGTPEPATLVALASGVIAMGMIRLRRNAA
jgi:hypothetical protein